MQYYTDKEMLDIVRRIEEKYGWIVEYTFDYEEESGTKTLYHYNVYVSGDDYVDHSVDAFERMGAYYVYVDYIEDGVAHLQVTLT